jgi:hypothetical protein
MLQPAGADLLPRANPNTGADMLSIRIGSVLGGRLHLQPVPPAYGNEVLEVRW